MKWMLGAITLALMVTMGLLAPDAPDRQRAEESAEAAPAAPEANNPNLVLVSARQAFRSAVADAARPVRYVSEISDREAVQIALRRGEEIAAARAAGSTGARERTSAPASATEAATATQSASVQRAGATGWRVTAERVNLRGGPGTDHPVVGGVAEGDILVPVSGIGSDWIEVRKASGETAWIYARFLARADG